MKWDELRAQECAIARFLSVLGDRWTLLIISDCFLGVRRFETFESRIGISRTILTRRLGELCENGVLERVAYRERPTRYEYRLTAKGIDLYPVVMSMTSWGNKYYAGDAGAPILFEHTGCGHDFSPEVRCSECGEPVPAWEVRARKRPDHVDHPAVLRGPIREDAG